jgi:hypothetical protein
MPRAYYRQSYENATDGNSKFLQKVERYSLDVTKSDFSAIEIPPLDVIVEDVPKLSLYGSTLSFTSSVNSDETSNRTATDPEPFSDADRDETLLDLGPSATAETIPQETTQTLPPQVLPASVAPKIPRRTVASRLFFTEVIRSESVISATPLIESVKKLEEPRLKIQVVKGTVKIVNENDPQPVSIVYSIDHHVVEIPDPSNETQPAIFKKT